jgi:hypothetical protein
MVDTLNVGAHLPGLPRPVTAAHRHPPIPHYLLQHRLEVGHAELLADTRPGDFP